MAWNCQFPWEDTQQVATGLRDVGQYVPTMTQYGSSGLYLPKFAAGEDDRVAVVWQMPHAYKIGGTIMPHVHWIATGGTGGDVGWRLRYQWVPIGGAFNPTTSVTPADVVVTYAELSGPPDIRDTHIVTELADIVPDAPPQGISSVLVGMLYRADQGGAGGEYDGEVFLVAFDAHYERDAEGSREHDVK